MFSEKIRQLRKDRHLTQAEVAKEVGLSARGYQIVKQSSKADDRPTWVRFSDVVNPYHCQ